MSFYTGEEENRALGLSEEPGGQQKTSQGDERISTPASHIASRKMR